MLDFTCCVLFSLFISYLSTRLRLEENNRYFFFFFWLSFRKLVPFFSVQVFFKSRNRIFLSLSRLWKTLTLSAWIMCPGYGFIGLRSKCVAFLLRIKQWLLLFFWMERVWHGVSWVCTIVNLNEKNLSRNWHCTAVFLIFSREISFKGGGGVPFLF